MTRWIVKVYAFGDEVRVEVLRNSRFYDESEIHPSEREELRRYLYSIVDEIVNEVTSDKRG